MILGFIIVGPVVRQNIIVGRMWQNKAHHYMVVRKGGGRNKIYSSKNAFMTYFVINFRSYLLKFPSRPNSLLSYAFSNGLIH
jgi:hypothetical protein